MNDSKFPIETYRKGNKITKICVEDVSRMTTNITDVMNKSTEKVNDIFLDIYKHYRDNFGQFIIGTGRSKPCLNDAFDEELGNNIAFMKAKLNANIKKHNMLVKAFNEIQKITNSIDVELSKVDDYIIKDLNALRLHNRDYLNGIENKLGIYEV